MARMRSPPKMRRSHSFHREIEAGATRVALTACTAAELVVDAAGLVTFGTDDAQAAGLHDDVVKLLPFGLHFGDLRLALLLQ